MTLPYATTTITVLRPRSDTYERGSEEGGYVTVGTVRAVVQNLQGRETAPQQSVMTFRLTCDPIDIQNSDRVYDNTTKLYYDVIWAMPKVGLGLEHTIAEVRRISR